MPVEHAPHRVHLDEQLGVEGDRLAQRLRTLHEEESRLLAGVALGELRHGAHAGRTRVVDHAPIVEREDGARREARTVFR